MSSSVMSRSVTARNASSARPGASSSPTDARADEPAGSKAVAQRAQMQALPCANGATEARSSALKVARVHQQADSLDVVDEAIAHRFGSPQSGQHEAQAAMSALLRNPGMASVPSRSRRA